MEEKLRQMQKKSSDLSDIVLEKSSKSTESTKKWLLTAASAILLFLIILIVMKMLKQSEVNPSDDNIANIGESVETINKEEAVAKEENLFKKEPIIDETSDTDEKFEEMVRKLKEQDAIIETPIVKKEEVKKDEEVKKEIVKEVKPKELKTIVQEPVPVITTPIVETPVVKQIKQPTKKEAPIKKVSQAFKQAKIPAISGYFIQVGATAKSFPDKRFLSKIKNAGFDYIVHGVNVKGRHIKKVLVGPYKSRDAAKNALGAVKANINHSAYIYRLR